MILMADTKPYDDSNWREEQKPYVSSKLQLEVLEHGPRSLALSWMMQAMKNQWKKRNGYKDPEPPDCSSSLEEWNESVKKYFKEDSKESVPSDE